MKAIEQGYQQQEIHTTAYRYFNEIERGGRRIVGVNHGTMDEQNRNSTYEIESRSCPKSSVAIE